jgi:hypothetical protein
MGITDLFAQSGSLRSIARELGITEHEAEKGAAELAPAILNGFHERSQQPGGIESLDSTVGQLGGAELEDNVVSPEPTDIKRGNSLLEHIFGSKDVSRNVAQEAAQRSGVGAAVLKKMLPMVAMMLAGRMARQGGGLGAALGGLLGLAGARGGLSGLGGMLGGRR